MRKLLFLALTAISIAACTNNPVQENNQNKSFMDLARERFAVREYAQTPVDCARDLRSAPESSRFRGAFLFCRKGSINFCPKGSMPLAFGGQTRAAFPDVVSEW